jgi:uncharacterized repeat protein (TIGR04138 family)
MGLTQETEAKIDALVAKHRLYRADAYVYVLEALSFTVDKRRKVGKEGHIDGRVLLYGIRELASRQFGYLASAVFQRWGVKSTLDFGAIVFHLVEAELLSKQDTDRVEDFADVFDFGDAFERRFVHPGETKVAAE